MCMYTHPTNKTNPNPEEESGLHGERRAGGQAVTRRERRSKKTGGEGKGADSVSWGPWAEKWCLMERTWECGLVNGRESVGRLTSLLVFFALSCCYCCCWGSSSCCCSWRWYSWSWSWSCRCCCTLFMHLGNKERN